MADQIASLEEDKRQYREQIDIVAGQLKDDAENPELRSLYNELKDMMTLIEESLAELQPKQPAGLPPRASPPPQASRAVETKYAPAEAAPAPAEAPEEEPAVTYQVNDEVQAKWLSGDKKFWPARITSITGSSSDPIYLVKFKSYKGTETLRARDIRPISNKRKADAGPAAAAFDNGTQAPAAAAGNPTGGGSGGGGDGIVLSAAASRYPEPPKEGSEQAKHPRAKKMKANKELEAGKSKWQEFSAKSKGVKKGGSKAFKKDSMFRTPDGVHGRVGFTGSGQAMRKDPTRSRHVYQPNEDLD